MEKKKLAERIKTALWPCVLLVFTVLLYGPLETYCTAKGELLVGLGSVVKFFAPAAVVAFLLLLAVCSLVWEKAAHVLLCLTFSLGLGLYLQGSFLNADYGVLNGAQIVWENYKTYGIINTIIWAAVILLPLVFLLLKRKLAVKTVSLASFFLTMIETVALVILLVTNAVNGASSADGETQSALSREGLYSVGSEQNTIVLIVDTLDTQYIDYLMENEPEYLEELEGFVYYNNATSSHPKTQGSVPYILSGELYRNEVPYSEYAQTAYEQSPLLNIFREAGYDIRVYTDMDTEYIARCVYNQTDGSYVPASAAEMGKTIEKYVMFRYAPHMLKKQFWMSSSDFSVIIDQSSSTVPYVINDVVFYRNLLSNGITVDEGEKALRIIHLSGCHEPFTLTSDVEFRKDDEQDAVEQLRGVMNILNTYLRGLKESGVYENTTILITGDHGATQRGQPAVLLKRPEAQSPMQVSDAPVSFADFHKTLVDCAGLDASQVEYGLALYTPRDAEEYVRTRYDYTIWSETVDGYLPYMWEEEYLEDNTEPRYTGRVFRAGEPESVEDVAKTLSLGETVSGNGLNAFFTPGFLSWGTDEYIWGTGKTTLLFFRLDQVPEEGVNVELSWIDWKLSDQQLVVSCKGEELFDHTYSMQDKENSAVIKVPKACFDDNGVAVLQLACPLSVSSFMLGTGQDFRLLNFGFQSMTVSRG